MGVSCHEDEGQGGRKKGGAGRCVTTLRKSCMRLLGALLIPMADVHVNTPETTDLDVLVVETVSHQHLIHVANDVTS